MALPHDDARSRAASEDKRPSRSNRAAVAVASLFGVGFLPVAPGTWATLIWGVPLVLVLGRLQTSAYLYATLAVVAVSCLTAGRACRALGQKDSRHVVIDELAGFLVSMFLVPLMWQMVATSFVLFRFFDIVKPWPVSWADRRVPGGLGVTLDDVLAGLYALALMHVVKLLYVVVCFWGKL